MNILLIVDMQKDFLEPNGGLWIGHSTTKLQEEVEKLAKAFHSTYPDGIVIFTQDSHKENSIEFSQFPKHCVQDTEGEKLVDSMDKLYDFFLKEKDMSKVHVISKKSFAGSGSHMGMILTSVIAGDSENISEKEVTLYVAGVCTHICVHDMTTQIVNELKNRGNILPKVIISRNCVDDFDPLMAEMSLKRLTSLYNATIL
jgi:nicotinamidase/pyrazinamidase